MYSLFSFLLSPAVDHLREEVFEADGVVEEYFAYDYMYVHVDLSHSTTSMSTTHHLSPVLMSLTATVVSDLDAPRDCLQ